MLGKIEGTRRACDRKLNLLLYPLDPGMAIHTMESAMHNGKCGLTAPHNTQQYGQFVRACHTTSE